MKRIFFIYNLLLITVLSSNAQGQFEFTLGKMDSINIARSNKISNIVLGMESDSASYVAFSIGDEILFLHKTCTGYRYHLFMEEFNYKSQQKELHEEYRENIANNKILSKVFSSKVYNKPFVYSTTDSIIKNYAHWDTKYIYLMIREKGVKKCEFNIPLTYMTNVSEKGMMPIEQDVFNFFLSKLIKNKTKEND